MISTLLLSALAVRAAPMKRQAIGDMPGELIKFSTGNTDPYSASELCLATTAANPESGSLVAFVDCHSVQTEQPGQDLYGLWYIQRGNQEGIQLAGTNFCLDAGDNPGSSPSTPAKIWQCFPGLPQQQFYYTDTDHIAVTGYTPCLDWSSSNGANFVACGSNYNNGDVQSFTIERVGAPNTGPSVFPSSTSTSTSASSTVSSATATSMSQPSATGRPIYWANGDDYSQCLTVTNGEYYNGSPVGIAPCAGLESQMWAYSSSGVTAIQIVGPTQNYCIDFGDNGGYDGVPMKIWECYEGLFQQTMYYTNTDHIAVYNGNQCLDVEAGTQNVQGWQCSGPDVHQHWSPVSHS